MIIYVITEGAYSEYHICAVTDDAGKAERLRQLFSRVGCQAEIETFDTEEVPDGLSRIPINSRANIYKVVDACRGELNVYQPVVEAVLSDDDLALYESYEVRVVNRGCLDTVRIMYETFVAADSAEEAKKIAADRIAPVKYERMAEWRK